MLGISKENVFTVGSGKLLVGDPGVGDGKSENTIGSGKVLITSVADWGPKPAVVPAEIIIE